MGIKNLISLSRPIDFHYKTNILIFIISVLITIFFNLNIAIYTFLAWAIAREIDIDNPLSAFISSLLCAIGYFYFKYESVYIILFILILLRAITNITGIKIKVFDYFLIALLFILSLLKFDLNFNLTRFLVILLIVLIFNLFYLNKKSIKTKCDNNNKKIKIKNYKLAIIIFSSIAVILNSAFFGLIIIGILGYNIATGYFGGVA